MLSITIHKPGEVAIFRCTGRITGDGGDALEAAVRAHPGLRVAVLDLGGISAVDARGLGILISLLMWSRTTHNALKLINLQPRVKEVLALTNLLCEFELLVGDETLSSRVQMAS